MKHGGRSIRLCGCVAVSYFKMSHFQARQAAASRSITKIQSHTGQILTDHDDINKAFLDFYSELYTPEGSTDSNKAFFENLNITAVPKEQNS